MYFLSALGDDLTNYLVDCCEMYKYVNLVLMFFCEGVTHHRLVIILCEYHPVLCACCIECMEFPSVLISLYLFRHNSNFFEGHVLVRIVGNYLPI